MLKINDLEILTHFPCAPPVNSWSKQSLKDLNYSSFEDLLTGRELLSDIQQEVLSRLHRRQDREPKTPERFFRNGYALGAVEYPGSLNYARCCERKGFSCRQPLFCAICASYEAHKFQLRFISSFDRYRWHFVTLSFPTERFVSDKFDDLELRWKIASRVRKVAAQENLFVGAVYREEIAITQFLPLMVRTHAHLIVCCEEGREFDSARIAEILQQESAVAGIEAGVEAKSSAITTLMEFVRTSNYLFKAMDLTSRYQVAWAINQREVGKGTAADRRFEANNDLTDLIFGVGLLGEGSRRYVHSGCLHHRSGEYAGLSSRQIAHRKTALVRRVKEAKENQ